MVRGQQHWALVKGARPTLFSPLQSGRETSVDGAQLQPRQVRGFLAENRRNEVGGLGEMESDEEGWWRVTQCGLVMRGVDRALSRDSTKMRGAGVASVGHAGGSRPQTGGSLHVLGGPVPTWEFEAHKLTFRHVGPWRKGALTTPGTLFQGRNKGLKIRSQ